MVRNKAAGVIIARDVIIAVEGHETLRDLEERVLVAQAEVSMRILCEGKGRRQWHLGIDGGGHAGARLAQSAVGAGAGGVERLDHAKPAAWLRRSRTIAG